MPIGQPYNRLGELAVGGIAVLTRVMLGDGTPAVLRELQSGKVLSLRQQRTFRRGTQVRELLSPHPNLVCSLERGAHGLRPYELIEYVEGKNLKVLMNSRAEVIRQDWPFILSECAEALAWVHRNRFMHLDVKPENFLVRLTKSRPVIKLTDFDLALKASENSPRPQMGTPAYMAPEQLRDKTAFPASDVFAFSILAYQLLTGRHPFPGDTPKESLRRQSSSSFIPKPPADIVPELNPRLSQLVMAGLEKSRERRLPDMDAFLSALRACSIT